MIMLQTLAIIGILIAGMMGQLSQVLQDLPYLMVQLIELLGSYTEV